MNRLDVRKTYKLYIGGNFVRSESGRSLAATEPDGAHLDNYPNASRKDFRNAVSAARPAFDAWAKKNGLSSRTNFISPGEHGPSETKMRSGFSSRIFSMEN